MLIFEPDFPRRIDLPGPGPCPRPVDIDRSHTGFARLVSLRVYSFARGMVIDGEAEGDEVFIVLMRGQADIGVDRDGERVGDFVLRIGEGARAVYLPPHAAYRLTARADCDIAYARSQPSATTLPPARAFTPADDRLLDIPGHATGMTLTLARLSADASLAAAGDDDTLPERLLHVRSDDGGAASVAERRIGDWASAALGDGERAELAIEQGTIDLLTISATARGRA